MPETASRTKSSRPLSTPPKAPRLAAAFFRRESDVVARQLLGKTLVHLVNGQRLSGRIVETEAYLGAHDRAAHSFGGRRTARTESMYLEGGHAYVFLIYGMHACFNVVTGAIDVPAAVLIRALEPTEGLGEMARLRKQKSTIEGAAHFNPIGLTNGPGKLCQALDIDRRLDRASLVSGETLWIENTRSRKGETISVSARVGIDYAKEAKDWPLRFSLHHPANGYRHVSKPWPCL